MQGIPVATDNIHKFYALFGIVLMISSALGFVYIHQSANEISYNVFVELETLKAKPERTKEEELRLAVLENQQTINKTDRDFYLKILSSAIGAGIGVAAWGFLRWHYKVQPTQDRLTRLQIEKLEAEIRSLNRLSRRR